MGYSRLTNNHTGVANNHTRYVCSCKKKPYNLYYPKYSLFDSFGSSVSLGTLSVQVCSDLQLSWISWSGGEPTPLQLVPHLPRVSQGMSIEDSCTKAVAKFF